MAKHQVRIVGGRWRRTLVAVADGTQLRPTPDRARETLFNWLGHLWGGEFAGRVVLDLFAGSGALGFEAASRGVARAQLVEANRAAAAGMRALKSRLGAETVNIHTGDAVVFLQNHANERYDLVFLDPPFGAGWLERLLPLMTKIVNPGGLLYLESEAPIGDLGPCWELLRQSRAGKVNFALARFAAMHKNSAN